MEDLELTQTIKSALHKKFPTRKFSVTRGGSWIEWTDDGPTVTEVEDAIIASGIVEIRDGWNGQRWLGIESSHSNAIVFDRYNAAERAAYQLDVARRQQERQASNQRVKVALAQVTQAASAALKPLEYIPPQFSNAHLQAANDAFEALRERAEVTVSIDAEEDRQRRPSWAPPLQVDDELASLCRTLGYLAPDHSPIARLWASFADPKKSRAALRKQFSTLPLIGLQCRGFQLFAGSERGNLDTALFDAWRTEAGVWNFGPAPKSVRGWHSVRWHNLTRQRLEAEDRIAHGFAYPDEQVGIEKIARELAELEAKNVADTLQRQQQAKLRNQVLQLAQQRVLEFVGAPDAQMQSAARLWGHCCICSKALTDPVSLERGIGPDCLHARVEFIRANRDKPRDWLVFYTGLPASFVTELLLETAQAASRVTAAPAQKPGGAA
jgi:hypothetical protein